MAVSLLTILASFVTIYLTTANRTNAENLSRLKERSAESVVFSISNGSYDADTDTDTGTIDIAVTEVAIHMEQPSSSATEGRVDYTYAYGQYASVFSLTVDKRGALQDINATLNLSREEYARFARDAWAHRERPVIMRIAGRQWIYNVAREFITRIENGMVKSEEKDDRFQVTFLDITASQLMLRNLRFTLLFISLAMFVVFFFVSLFFSNRAIRPLKTAWEKQQQFIADASHELKTPLSVIAANHDALLANREQTIASQQEWIDYQKRGIERMSLLIDDLLSIARLENPKRQEEHTLFNLSALLKEEISLMEPAMHAKQLALETVIDSDIPFHGNREQIRKLFLILMDNAIKYSDESGSIMVEVNHRGNAYNIVLRNTGQAIPPEEIDKIFDRFYRTDSARSGKIKGHGLGLSIAKSIIDNAGGRIQIQCEEGKWIVLSVFLPQRSVSRE
jgi:signal transduction histidine kinase